MKNSSAALMTLRMAKRLLKPSCGQSWSTLSSLSSAVLRFFCISEVPVLLWDKCGVSLTCLRLKIIYGYLQKMLFKYKMLDYITPSGCIALINLWSSKGKPSHGVNARAMPQGQVLLMRTQGSIRRWARCTRR